MKSLINSIIEEKWKTLITKGASACDGKNTINGIVLGSGGLKYLLVERGAWRRKFYDFCARPPPIGGPRRLPILPMPKAGPAAGIGNGGGTTYSGIPSGFTLSSSLPSAVRRHPVCSKHLHRE